MALVLLPCDLPTWPAVQRQLNALKCVQKSEQLIDVMYKMHDLCCVSLDPDLDDRSSIEIFRGLQEFLDGVLSTDERNNFFQAILPTLTNYALRLRLYRPVDGMQYSLQQQADCSDLDRKFVASLMANAFFSTFPRRTSKTHPTLQDCNFSRFFVHLKCRDQHKKLRSLFEYFDRISAREPTGKVVFSRKVTPKMAELDLDDWLQCNKLLCPVTVRHDDRAKQTDSGSLKVYFGNSRIGGLVLDGGGKQEDAIFGAFPELFVALMSTERIETNEAFTAHDVLPIDAFSGMESSGGIDGIDGCYNTHVCVAEAMDLATDERHLLEAAMVRELNKALTAFRQDTAVPSMRLRPIGKSLSATPPKDLSPIKEDATPTNTRCLQHQDAINAHLSSDDFAVDVAKSLMWKKSDLMKRMLPDDDDDDPTPGPFKFEMPKTFQGSSLGRIRGENKTEFESNVRRSSRPVTSRGLHHCPFDVQNKRLIINRGESEESFYVDCGDNLDELGKKEDRFLSTRCGGIMFSRPLKLLASPRQDEPADNCKPVERHDRGGKSPPSPLDGLTSLEASFVSCYTHKSSRSSSKDTGDSSDEHDNDVDGYQSCSEELEDVYDVPSTDSRRTTITEEELQSEFEIHPKWGRRVESGPVNCRRVKPSLSCTTDSADAGNDGDNDKSCQSAADVTQDSWAADERGLRLRRRCVVPRRAASTGFTMDEDDDEEDIFVGDSQLEHEREWMASFRHRSANPSRSSMSRADSSRYSFSSDFSSDLEDIYEHFEEKMTEGPVRDDPAIRSRLGDRLKRTLSDSLASFPRVAMTMPRSLSLTERMHQERTMNKQRVCNDDDHAPDGVDKMANFEEYYDYYSPLDQDPANPTSCSVGSRRRLVGTADVAIKQNLCDIDERIELSRLLILPRTNSPRLVRLPSQLSVWWNYNSVYDFCVPLSHLENNRPPAPTTTTTTNVTLGRSTPRAPEGWPLSRMSSFKMKRCGMTDDDVVRRVNTLILQVPCDDGCRRSKSATNYEELAKSLKSLSSDSDSGIAKSRSLTTVSAKVLGKFQADDVDDDDTKSLIVTADDVVNVKSSSMTVGKSKIIPGGLRKWQAAFNLNDLVNGSVDDSVWPAVPSPSLESSLKPCPDAAERAHAINTEKSLDDAGLRFGARRLVATNDAVSEENFQQPLKSQLVLQSSINDVAAAAANAFRPIETGNWVSESSESNEKNENKGSDSARSVSDPQLMALVVWMAASRADAPLVIYHTGGDQRIVKLSIVSRVLLDRRWSVGHIARAVLAHYAAPSRRKSPDTDQDVDILESLLPKETDK